MSQLAIDQQANAPLQPSSLIADRYRVAEVIGQGGVAVVYRVLDETYRILRRKP